MTSAARLKANRTGRRAETFAALLLRAKGYRIRARNWRHPAGEVDIIASRRQALVFIEVKARADIAAGREAVQPRQQERITRAAQVFLASHPECANMHVRFDLMVIAPYRWPDHIQAAWGHD